MSLLDNPTFDYDPPLIGNILPAAGRTLGSELITLYGESFGFTPTVTIDGIACAITNNTHRQIVVRTPENIGTNRLVYVAVAGQSSTPNYFSYIGPLISSVSPSQAASGDTLTIHGDNFGNSGGSNTNTTVTVGGNPCFITLHNHTLIECTVPVGQGSSNAVMVKVLVQLSNTRPFQYALPVIASISPTNAPSAGGDVMTITGGLVGVYVRVCMCCVLMRASCCVVVCVVCVHKYTA